MTEALLYIGLMSGTSMDAVDAVLLAIGEDGCAVKGHHSQPILPELRADISALSHSGADSIDLLGATDKRIATLFADAALALMHRHRLTAGAITAIGSHGQTIRHRPGQAGQFTIQIGDPSTIAALTDVTTIADFRRKDMALGGQGAPLVPAFHQHVFRHPTINRAIINIGGIANITWLPSQRSQQSVLGFDTGPGNCLMDAWIRYKRGDSFDRDGLWAASGRVDAKLLARLLFEPYLQQPPPKSTGKELFNLDSLSLILCDDHRHLAPQDIQATLCEFTVATIADGLKQIPGNPSVDEIYLCGGGALSPYLVRRLQDKLPHQRLSTTAAMGIDPMHVEAAAFAWLAHQTLHKLPGNISAVTGASREAVLGGIYFP
ncbi:MAG: anhydro-N-acetylmuramic acid kinase [Porticoccaceae bacterium]